MPEDKKKEVAPEQKEADSSKASKQEENQPSATQEIKESDLMAMVTKAVSAGLAEKSKEDSQLQQVSEADIKKAVDAAFEKAKKNIEEGQKLADKLDEIVSGAAQKAFASMKTEKKEVHSVDESKSPRIEMPVSDAKGNLPLWKKQLVNIGLKRPMNHGVPESILADAGQKAAKWDSGQKRMQLASKALTVAGSGTGAEFIPDDLSSQLMSRFYLNSQIAQFFLSREIEMPTNPYTFPLSTTRPVLYYESTEGTSATSTDPGTSEIVLSAKKFLAKTEFSYEIDEDSIIAMAPFVVDQLSKGAADGYEDAILNGDTTATHQDSDVSASNDRRKAWNGLRKLAISGSLATSLNTGGITYSNLMSLRKLMGKYAVGPSDLLWICGPQIYYEILEMDEVKTVDLIANQAVILQGQIPTIMGIPIILSEMMRENLNASGVYDGVTTDRAGIFLVNTSEWLAGRRRDFLVESDRLVTSQELVYVMSMRRAFTPKETPSTSLPSLAFGYNIAV